MLISHHQIYVSSRNNPMRGTVAFERLNCGGSLYLRLLLNDAVYRKLVSFPQLFTPWLFELYIS